MRLHNESTASTALVQRLYGDVVAITALAGRFYGASPASILQGERKYLIAKVVEINHFNMKVQHEQAQQQIGLLLGYMHLQQLRTNADLINIIIWHQGAGGFGWTWAVDITLDISIS